jgi:hypothetical protein
MLTNPVRSRSAIGRGGCGRCAKRYGRLIIQRDDPSEGHLDNVIAAATPLPPELAGNFFRLDIAAIESASCGERRS